MDHGVQDVSLLPTDLKMSPKPTKTTKTDNPEKSPTFEIPKYSVDDLYSWTFSGNILWNSFKVNHIAECSTKTCNSSLPEHPGKVELPNVQSRVEIINPSVNRYFRKEKEWSFFLGWWHE